MTSPGAVGDQPGPALVEPSASGRPLVISSANGLQAIEKAMSMLKQKADPLDAVIAAVNVLEDDPNDHSVGLGGIPNEDGVVELDACCMHGPTHKAGAVAALRNIRNPSSVARLVMQRTDHVLLVGEGALRFAKAHGFAEEELLTDHAREQWVRWKESLSDKDDWLSPAEGDGGGGNVETSKRRNVETSKRRNIETSKSRSGVRQRQSLPQDQRSWATRRSWGTINCCAVDGAANLAGVTTTSGLAYKIPGRVGDSPIIGAGLYVDNAVGAAGSTGRGEANLQNCASFLIVELMRSGRGPEQACLEVLKRIADHTEPRLRDRAGRPAYGLMFYAVTKDGRHAGASMWSGGKYAVHDGPRARLEEVAYLYQTDKKGKGS
jgi:N4-(beta-N-acetylglucosaminyl)-L-asparaginase